MRFVRARVLPFGMKRPRRAHPLTSTRGYPSPEYGARKSQPPHGDIPGWSTGRENPSLHTGISQAAVRGEKIPTSPRGYSQAGARGEKIPTSTRGYPSLEYGARKSQPPHGDIPARNPGQENPNLHAGISQPGVRGEKIPTSTRGYPRLEYGARNWVHPRPLRTGVRQDQLSRPGR